MLKGLMASALILASTLSISAPVAAQEQPIGVCTRDRHGSLNLRTRPSLYSRIIRRIPRGSTVVILDISKWKGKWVKVRYKRSIGWVSGDYLCYD